MSDMSEWPTSHIYIYLTEFVVIAYIVLSKYFRFESSYFTNQLKCCSFNRYCKVMSLTLNELQIKSAVFHGEFFHLLLLVANELQH